MTGSFGGLGGGDGCNHRPLTGAVGGRRTAIYAAHGYTRGHPGDGPVSNPPTYQVTRQLGHDLKPLRATLYRSSRHDWHTSVGATLTRSASLPAVGGGFTKPVPFRAPSGKSFHEMQASRLMAQMPAISPW
mmetsp:Transcript_89728/g.274693  ORF Transcript_89728/g.274693 Transcript_89728/m.274693 type:complete len:131 (-) Transcript_89728:79-471(-)